MSLEKKPGSSAPIVRTTYATFFYITVAWVGAWFLKVLLQESLVSLTTSSGSFLYWTIAKIIIWILPAWRLLRLSGRTPWQAMNLSNWKSWLVWGGGLGFLIALTGIIPKHLQGAQLLPVEFSFPLLNVIVIAPIFEEFLMRGAILGNLQQVYSFFVANTITSLMFVVLHVPGWYFMGTLAENVARPVGGALSIFLVSLVFGYATQKSRSVMGGVLSHFLNNLF